MSLKNLKIRKKLTLGFAVPVIISLVMLILCNSQMINLRGEYEDLINKHMQLESTLLKCIVENNAASRIVRDIVLDTTGADKTENQSSLNTVMTNMESYLSYVEKNYSELLSDGKEKTYANAVREWKAEASSIATLASSGNFAQAEKELKEKCQPALANLRIVAEDVEQEIDNLVADKQKELQTLYTTVLVVSIIIIVVALAIVFVFAKYMVRSIVEPTTEIHKAIIGMSEGVLDTPVYYEAEDEIGEMAEALRKSQNVLRKACSDISHITSAMADGKFNITVDTNLPGTFVAISESLSNLQQKMNSMIAGVKRSVEQVSAGAEQVANGSQALAQGATEQASAVEQLSASINDISEGARQNAEATRIARENADQAGEQNRASQEQMTQMIAAMDDITDKSKEISKIIKTIEDIAFQTNILALNAAVEAARAGSAGKGFAVVADEVRNLASKSAEAAKNTTTLIEDSIRAVEHGSSIAHAAADTITVSTELTTQAVNKITQIADATERASEAIDQVTQGIDQIATVVQTNSATSEESAAASEELSSQANVMRQIFSSFEVEDDSNSFGGFEAKQVGGSFNAGGTSPHVGDTFRQSDYQYDDLGKY